MCAVGMRFVASLCRDGVSWSMCMCGGCSKGGKVLEVCSVGRVCGDVIKYVYAASGRGEVHHDVCERNVTRRVRGSE